MSELNVPNSWQDCVITDKGLALLSKLIKGHSLYITRAEAGTGFVAPNQLIKQAAVSEPIHALSFETISYPAEGKCCIPCKLTNTNLETSSVVRQVGIYARDPDEGEILYCITQVKDEAGGTGIPANNILPSYAVTWTLVVYYGMADNVSITVDPAGAVTREEVDQVVHDSLEEAVNGLITSVGSAIKVVTTIPVSAWREGGEDEGATAKYPYVADIEVPGCTSEHFPIVALYGEVTLDAACDAGVSPTSESLSGSVRVWAAKIPNAELNVSISLRSENIALTEIEHFNLVDKVTGSTYEVYVENTKLSMNEVE